MSLDITPAIDPATAPPRFHMLSKPTGAACNLDCKYCFFLSKDALYPDDRLRMSDEVLERYIKQLLESHQTPTVTVAWQGGEPTLMGVTSTDVQSSTSRNIGGPVKRWSTRFRPTAS